MKKLLLLLLTFACYQMSQSQIPYKNPFFADDIVIHNQPERDQRSVALASSNIGWEFSVYTYGLPGDSSSATYMKSIDDGESWTLALDFPGSHYEMHKVDLLTTGDSVENSYLQRLTVLGEPALSQAGFAVWELSTLQVIWGHYTPPGFYIIRDAAFANDNGFRANGADPGSLALAFSHKNVSSSGDGISVWTSGSSGYMVETQKNIYNSSTKYIEGIDISYGHAPSLPDGKYFVVWDQRDFFTTKGGHIFYSHNIDGFNSNYSTAVDLNQFMTGSDNLLKNPKIAVQTSSSNNGGGNITAVVIAEKYDMVTQKTQIVGFVNDKAATDDHNWKSFTIGDPAHISMQPDIAYNMYDSTFMVVYFDSTEKKIPYLLHKFDFDENPIQWNILSPGINNSDSISNPLPQVKLCYSQHTGAVVWVSENEMGNGVGRYDAPLHYYTGVKESSGKTSVKVYPNPASDDCTIDLLNNNENVEISLTSSNGIEVKSFRTDQTKIQIPLTDIQEGFYLIKITSSQGISIGKVVVNR